MSNRVIALFVAVFALVVAGMFYYTFLVKEEMVDTAQLTEPVTATSTDYKVNRIDAKHFFIDGVHTIVGEISLPTPCDLLTTDASVAESMPEQVTFNFAVVNTTETCAQIVTNQRFKVEASASQLANLKATFMNVPVELNLVEAAAGETPEEFELYIKG